MRIIVSLLLTCCLLSVSGACGAVTPEVAELFVRVFGDAAHFDPAMCAKVLGEEHGKRHYVDNDGDGKPDELWFIDGAKRHPAASQPLLVRVIDEDGDLEEGHEPDLDSDLYLADWKADGSLDVVCDYTDDDGDGDVDDMAFYFQRGKEERIMVWWGKDIGDDNLLWYDVGYNYNQGLCQYRTHFGGNEIFCAFFLGKDDPVWEPAWENPFVFYDHDGDGVTEEVVRIEGRADDVEKLRYSYNADNDDSPDNPRDFDVSVSAHAGKGLTFTEAQSEGTVLRGIPTGTYLSYKATPQFARETIWAKYQLTWDENDLNMDGDRLEKGRFRDTQERWEGVITKGNEYFDQIGGPSGGLFNKRYEVDTDAKNVIRVYYMPADQRVHLYSADHAWLSVDLDYDQKQDMRYEFTDTDSDGYLDTTAFDADADGKPDDTWRANAAPQDIAYTYPELNAIMGPLMATQPEKLYRLCRGLEAVLAAKGHKELDPVALFLVSGCEAPGLTEDLRLRLLRSNEAWRYYLDVWKDRLVVTLKGVENDAAFWSTFDGLRAKGDVEGLCKLVGANDASLSEWRAQLLAKFDKPRVAWAQDWAPPNIGWESDRCGYRAYWGQFDFFGKTKPGLVMDTFAGGPSYHAQQEWGMDALHVGETCGIGGVTLYANGKPYPVYSPNGEGNIRWSKRLVSIDDSQVAVELLAENVGPVSAPYTVRFTCSTQVGRKDSTIEVTVEGGPENTAIELGLGLTRLPQEQSALDKEAGVLANWGVQEPAIGTIGMGVLFPPEVFLRQADSESEHQVILRAAVGTPVRYRIQGDWLRGRRFARCPGLGEWMAELRLSKQGGIEP